MSSTSAERCRACASPAVDTVLDLGQQPVADDLLDDRDRARNAPRYRLALGCCRECGLVQLDAGTPLLANAAHGHGSSYSGTVLQHEQQWAQELLARLPVAGASSVLDVGGGSGGLLRHFAEAGHRVRGWERDVGLADRASEAGLPTIALDDASQTAVGEQFDLVLSNHTLSHADDLDDAVAALAGAVAPDGTLAVEFHHALGILAGGQFDVVCHAHRSYLSLSALQSTLVRHGMTVTRARTLPLHGGVVRLQARHAGPGVESDAGVADVLTAEAAAGLASSHAWAEVTQQANRVRTALRQMLETHRAAGRTVAAYGAPSRGTTLLNWCGIGVEELPRTADRSPAKQGRFLPGAATAVCTPEDLAADRPDIVVVLVWPFRTEVLAQLDALRRAGTQFLFPLPEPELVA